MPATLSFEIVASIPWRRFFNGLLGAGGLRVHTWRDANVLYEVSMHLTLIIKSYSVSRFSAVVTVPHQIAGSGKAKMR
jgi:hypothetical protein